MGEVQTDSPASVKVTTATHTSQIPAEGLRGSGFRTCLEKLAVRGIAARAKWRCCCRPRAAFSGCQHQREGDRCDPTLCSDSQLAVREFH